MHALAEAFVENLVGIHEVNYEAADCQIWDSPLVMYRDRSKAGPKDMLMLAPMTFRKSNG